MKEKDIEQIESMGLFGLTTLEELLLLEKYDKKKGATEALKFVQDEIAKRKLYPNATDEELQNLHFRMGRLTNEGHDFLEDMQTIENELIRRDEKRIDSGVIFQADDSQNRENE